MLGHSSVANPICQEGQGERTFLIFFLFFLIFFSLSLIFSLFIPDFLPLFPFFFLIFPLFSPILAKFLLSGQGYSAPTWPRGGYATA